MSNVRISDYQKIASDHGVDLDEVRPLSQAERIEKLESILSLDDVPYPIPVEKRESYWPMHVPRFFMGFDKSLLREQNQ